MTSSETKIGQPARTASAMESLGRASISTVFVPSNSTMFA